MSKKCDDDSYQHDQIFSLFIYLIIFCLLVYWSNNQITTLMDHVSSTQYHFSSSRFVIMIFLLHIYYNLNIRNGSL